ncbi:MAG: hypothetical protein WEE89_19385 [Gemmatimonadota bacterium]
MKRLQLLFRVASAEQCARPRAPKLTLGELALMLGLKPGRDRDKFPRA